jgi:hypothetical protein
MNGTNPAEICRAPNGPRARVAYPRPRLGYLLKELFGLHDPNDLYIYVTDAGHWENTGLVELIRDRNIDEVVCLDADEQSREKAHQAKPVLTQNTPLELSYYYTIGSPTQVPQMLP